MQNYQTKLQLAAGLKNYTTSAPQLMMHMVISNRVTHHACTWILLIIRVPLVPLTNKDRDDDIDIVI